MLSAADIGGGLDHHHLGCCTRVGDKETVWKGRQYQEALSIWQALGHRIGVLLCTDHGGLLVLVLIPTLFSDQRRDTTNEPTDSG